MQNSVHGKDLSYVGVGQDAGKKRHFTCRPKLFVFNVGVTTLMDMERCVASMDSPAHNSVDVLLSVFLPLA